MAGWGSSRPSELGRETSAGGSREAAWLGGGRKGFWGHRVHSPSHPDWPVHCWGLRAGGDHAGV